MSSSSDETLLEAFIESLHTLPSDVRRNLDLLKDLDTVCSADLQKLQQLQRDYILAAEKKMMNLQLVEMEDEESDEDEDQDAKIKADREDEPASSEKKRKAPVYGVRVLNADGTTSSEDNPVVLPTTQEFMAYTYQPDAYKQIRALQKDCLQKADEKVAVAQQAYEMMDAQVQRLDADLAAMEQILQVRVTRVPLCRMIVFVYL